MSCSCLFYPSTFKETFGLVLAEANAVGTPVIKLAGPALEHGIHRVLPSVHSGQDSVGPSCLRDRATQRNPYSRV